MKIDSKSKKQIMELIVFAGIVLWIVFNYTLFIDLIKFVFKLIVPLITGIAISFIINVPMKKLEKGLFNVDKRKHKKLIRVLSLLISVLLIFGIIGLLMFLIIPEFIEAVINISKSLPKSYDWINKLISKIHDYYPDIANYIKNINIEEVITQKAGNSTNMISNAIGFVTSFISKVVTFFISFIIAIYILLDKEKICKSSKRILTAFFGNKITDEVIKITKISNKTFSKFLTGQCLDASLTGFLLFLLLTLFKLPYALIIGVLFAVTALIPYIGSFITLLVGGVLLGVVNPIYTFWYVIIFFLLQQFDDNFTYPRIVGGSVGLPPLIALLAVIIGGSMFGFVGMIISIPLFSIMYNIFNELIDKKLKENKE